MYENTIITEPKWKSWIVQTTTPLFTPDQCRQIIECGRSLPPQQAQVGMGKPGGGTDTDKRVTTISWIPFKQMEPMYRDLNNFIQTNDPKKALKAASKIGAKIIMKKGAIVDVK